MPQIRISARTFLVFIFLLITACVQTSQSNLDAINNAGIRNLSTHDGSVFASGQPTQEQIQILASAGVKHVINLRPVGEQEWDESALVKSLGMEYHSIEVAGAADVTSANAQALSQLLASLDGEPVLLHCASSNRVGALMALGARDSEGLSVEDSLAKGRSWGLTGLEESVRTILAE